MSYRVYFGRLPESLAQDDFEKMLEQFGKARNIEWKSGYAYVDYKHGSDASNTVQNLNGKEIGGNNILVELAKVGAGGYSVAGGFSARMNKPLPRPIRTPYRLRIENLSSRAKWMELKELLSLAGEVTFADTHKRRQGEGIVEFGNRKDLVEAISMFDKTLFFGRTIRLFDESSSGGSRSYREYQYRSRSRSPVRRRSFPSPKDRDRKKRSRSKSKSPNRKTPHSERKTESSRKIRSKSASPRRKSEKQKISKSPSSSPTYHTSAKRRERSRTPTKSSRHTHKKSKKSKKDTSRSRSRSPRKKHKEKDGVKRKHKKQSYSTSGSDSEKDMRMRKPTQNNKKSRSDSESGSDSEASKDGSENNHK